MIIENRKNKLFFQILIYEFYENIRNKWLYYYGLIFLLFSSLIFYLDSAESSRAVVSLLNMILLILPLFSLLFGSLSFNHSSTFVDMLLTRPISRFQVFFGKWLGMIFGLNVSFVLGMSVSGLLFLNSEDSKIGLYFLLIFYSILINIIYVSISFFIAVIFKSRELVLIVSLLLWFYFYLFYDLFIMGFSINFGEYPLEFPLLLLVLLNPIDLVRIAILIQLDVGSLMGFSAAIFSNTFSGFIGTIITVLTLIFWSLIPILIGYRVFNKKDL